MYTRCAQQRCANHLRSDHICGLPDLIISITLCWCWMLCRYAVCAAQHCGLIGATRERCRSSIRCWLGRKCRLKVFLFLYLCFMLRAKCVQENLLYAYMFYYSYTRMQTRMSERKVHISSQFVFFTIEPTGLRRTTYATRIRRAWSRGNRCGFKY